MQLDGYPTTLIDLSRGGAQVLVPKPLRFNQAGRISISDEEGPLGFGPRACGRRSNGRPTQAGSGIVPGSRSSTRMPSFSTSCASAIAWSNRSHRRAGYRRAMREDLMMGATVRQARAPASRSLDEASDSCKICSTVSGVTSSNRPHQDGDGTPMGRATGSR